MISKRTGTTHMCISVLGLMKHKGKIKGFTNESGRELTDKEVRAYLKKCDFEGKRVIPMGECDNFDFQTGCRGHDITLLVHDYEFEEGNG